MYMSLLQRLLFQKAFNSQQLVHITVINLFQLHHLRDFSSETEQHSYSQDEQLCWTQLLALFSEYENCSLYFFCFYMASISHLLSKGGKLRESGYAGSFMSSAAGEC